MNKYVSENTKQTYLQLHSAAYGGLDQAPPSKERLCTAAPVVPEYCLALMQQNQNALLIQNISKIAR